MFNVDGDPFPWYLPENPQPAATRVLDDLYLVEVEFMAVPQQQRRLSSFTHTEWYQPTICGIVFPWYISEDGVTYRCSRTDVPMIRLAFFADAVEGLDVTDARPEDGKAREFGGRIVAKVAF